jgi:hypothetical protein
MGRIKLECGFKEGVITYLCPASEWKRGLLCQTCPNIDCKFNPFDGCLCDGKGEPVWLLDELKMMCKKCGKEKKEAER